MQSLPSKGLALIKMLPMQAQNNDRGRWISNAYLASAFKELMGNFKRHPSTTKLWVRESGNKVPNELELLHLN
jgi:hypothetical protein